MACYINGIGTVSAQKSLVPAELLTDPVDHVGEKLTCIEPDYSRYFDVRQLRRMSRIIRMGMAAGIDALRESHVDVPDGIITGTGYGCLEDTGIFLGKMIDNREQALNPTPFIQSTHNTIGSQLALLLQCQGYNQTYTQRAFSFENALTDALMMIADEPSQSLLTGAADEITATSHDILRRFGLFRTTSASSLRLFDTPQRGTLNGEGAAYFLLSGIPQPGCVQLIGITTFYKPSSARLKDDIRAFMSTSHVAPGDVDVVFSGKCGHPSFDSGIDDLLTDLYPQATHAVYKHLTGEFPSAIAIAMAIACRVIQAKRVPTAAISRDMRRAPARVLIYNRYFNSSHSLILLAAY